jgi:hypothetical protein
MTIVPGSGTLVPCTAVAKVVEFIPPSQHNAHVAEVDQLSICRRSGPSQNNPIKGAAEEIADGDESTGPNQRSYCIECQKP